MTQGQQGGCLPFVIAVVAALSVRDPILRDSSIEEGAEIGDDQQEINPQPQEEIFIKNPLVRNNRHRNNNLSRSAIA